MPKYRLVHKPNKRYEGLIQKKVFGLFWKTIYKAFFLEDASHRFNDLKKQGFQSFRVVEEYDSNA